MSKVPIIPDMRKNNAIDVEGVEFSYGSSPVLEDVEIAIPEGDFACAVGPNGGGKTTLLKIILGLLHPDKGRVQVFGGSPEVNRPHIGYIPQRHRLDPHFPANALDVVLMGRLGVSTSFGPYGRRDKDLASSALDEVGLYPLRHRAFSELSGGQQQRALIARALACEPKILLLDEPTANLDVHMETALYQLLSKLNERMTVVMVSHDVGVVSQLVRTVICVNRKVMVHPTAELTGDMIREMYGGEFKMVRHDLECHHGDPH
jgi:zinc transport system ATP-binding protein